MTRKSLGRVARIALWVSPILIVVGGFIALVPWAKQRNPALINVLGVAAAICVMLYSLFLAQRHRRGLDEVQLAHQGFANSRGWIWGGMAGVLLLTLPPVMNWMVDLVNATANAVGSGSRDLNNGRAVRLAFVFGICLVMVMQTLGVIIAAIVWQRRMGGPVWGGPVWWRHKG